ncbi:MAG: VOC family protein [Myxococcales bacterium]|nr:VOC family protein [Myxococcales bacterium]MCB9732163.1 VOC family protein [Deltaproteobacteria bacterium]
MTLFRVVLPVADLERAAAFYAALLDLGPGRRVSPNRHWSL